MPFCGLINKPVARDSKGGQILKSQEPIDETRMRYEVYPQLFSSDFRRVVDETYPNGIYVAEHVPEFLHTTERLTRGVSSKSANSQHATLTI